MTVFSAGLLLFLVMDPFGNIPLFLTALKGVESERIKRVVLRELLIALFALLVFLFGGQYLMAVLGITEPSLTIAGGIILFLIALKMIFPNPGLGIREEIEGEPFIVPLAIPYVAGPSAMASVLLITSQEPHRWQEWLLALILAWGLSAIIIYYSTGLSRFLGKRGLVALERLMGMVLTAIAVQMFLEGVRKFLNGG
jgi:multiple antibiotic resistance protein